MILSEKEFRKEVKRKLADQLNAKLALGDFICDCLANDDDPRSSPTIARMRREQQWIQDEQARRKAEVRRARGEPEPEPTVIKLKTLKVRGKVEDIQ